jgi:DNA-binding transcriptional ArsR family regulator
MGEYKAGQLDRVFSALGDPTRRAILARLSSGDARVTDLAAGFSISLNSVSKHIRALERAGLLRRRIMGREHVLSIAPAPLADAASWIDHYRRFWEGRLADLETFVLEKRRKRQ